MGISFVFISYRHDASEENSRRTLAAFRRLIPDEQVFLDSSSINAGDRWHPALDAALDRLSHLIVLIDRNWNSEIRGKLRLFEPGDWVAREIHHALINNKSIIPVLIDGAKMPTDLPERIRGLKELHAISTTSESLTEAVGRIIKSHEIGLLNKLRIEKLLIKFRQIAELRPDLGYKLKIVQDVCKLQSYETLIGIVDLTMTGNGKHFLAFTNAGMYHRTLNTTSSCSFVAYHRISKLEMDKDGRNIRINNELWSLDGTIPTKAFALIAEIISDKP